jgi:hypothetical protein
MIKYSLICSEKHEFEVWFSNSSDYDAQKSKLLISCPYCSSTKIEKGIMAPNIASSRKREKTAMEKNRNLSDLNSVIGKLRQHIKEKFEYVGDKFPEEARAIYYGEKEERKIYGEASLDEAINLQDEGISLSAIPQLASPKNKKKLN